MAPRPPRPPKLPTLLFFSAILSILSFYAGLYTGLRVGSCSGDDATGADAVARGLRLDATAGSGGNGNNGGNNNGGCTTQCLKEIQQQDGELQRRVEQLAREKVREGTLRSLPILQLPLTFILSVLFVLYCLPWNYVSDEVILLSLSIFRMCCCCCRLYLLFHVVKS